MSDEGTAGAAERFTEALHAVDRDDDGALERMAELFSETATLTNAATETTGHRFEGRDGARDFWREYRTQFARAETEFHDVTTAERAAGLFWRTRGEARGGDALDYAGATLLVFDADGLVERFHGYYDTRRLVVDASGAG